MINVGKTNDQVRVVNDQIGTPTYTPDLSRLLVDMIESDKYTYFLKYPRRKSFPAIGFLPSG